MIERALFGLMLAATPQPEQVAIPCHMKIGVGIGCIGQAGSADQAAAELFRSYGLSAKEMSAYDAQAYINSFDCLRIKDAGGHLDIKYYGNTHVPTRQGIVTVRYVRVRGDRETVLWVADDYFDRPCPRVENQAQ